MFRKSFLSRVVPLARAFHSAKLIRDHNRFGIIGVPFAKGQRKSGVDLGPSAIRSGGLISHLKEIAGKPLIDHHKVHASVSNVASFRLRGRP